MSKLQKALFLDRDGVLNRELGAYVTCIGDFEILPHVAEALHLLQQQGYLLIVITNQGGIAKGLYSKEDLNQMHQLLEQQLAQQNIFLSAIYYCPHHPDLGACLCRKPQSLLVEKALARFRIDPNRSWFIGDKDRDMQCAEGAGVKGIKIESNANWIPEAKWIIDQNEKDNNE